jgi:hypothetical protein
MPDLRDMAEPLMRAIGKVFGQRAGLRSEAVALQDRERVELQMRIEGELPVGPGKVAPFGEVPVFKPETCDQAIEPGEKRIEFRRGGGIQNGPDEAGALACREADKVARPGIDRAEEITRGDCSEGAVEGETSGVIGAGEAGGVAAVTRKFRTAVGAGIEKGPHLSIAAAHYQQRDAAEVQRLVVPRSWQLAGGRQDKWHPAEHRVHLAVKSCGVGVDRGRPRGGLRSGRDGSGIETMQHCCRIIDESLARIHRSTPPCGTG